MSMRDLIVVLALAALIITPSRGLTQTTDDVQALRNALEELRQGQLRLEKDVQDIKALLLRGRQAAAPDDVPKNLVLAIDEGTAKGDKGAKLVLVDFTDYQ
jgi:hypothetical protein